MKKLNVCTALCLLSSSTLIFAGSMGDVNTDNSKAKLFVGLGGSYNSVQIKQNLYAIGNATYSGAVTGAGVAQGPATPFYDTVNTFAPEVQTGIYQHFKDSDHLWGLKFSYQYLGATPTHDSFTARQVGTVNGATLIGNLLVGSTQTKVEHELLFLPYIGHSFSKSQVYFGAGPALFGTRSNINDAIGFANLFASPTDITGQPINFSHPEWIWGGAAQLGLSYAFAPDLTVDVNYTYAITGQYNYDASAAFTNFVKSQNITITGIGIVNTTQSLANQALSVSINKVFSM